MFEGLRTKNSFSYGVGIGVLLHSWQFVIILVLTIGIPLLYHPRASLAELGGFVFSLMAWSLTQFIYMGPGIVIAFRAGKNETAKGLILVSAIGVLLNGACDAFFFGLRF